MRFVIPDFLNLRLRGEAGVWYNFCAFEHFSDAAIQQEFVEIAKRLKA